MIGVQFAVDGDLCITDDGRKDMLENLERYRAALDRCNATIEEFNKTVIK